MGLTLDGLASGMPTAELIAATMAVERLPQQSLQAKVSASKTLTTGLQDLNAKIAALTTSAVAYSKLGAMNILKATSSSSAITVLTNDKAMAGQLDVSVGKLAAKHSAVTASMSDFGSDTLTLTRPGADPLVITADSNSLDDIVKAVNTADAGVTATKVPTGDGTFRLQFTAVDSGKDAVFDIEASGASLFTAPGAAVIRQGSDAEVTLYAGTAAEQVITSSTNTFEDLLPGMTITVNATTTSPATIAVEKDIEESSKKVSGFVDSINGIFGFIQLKSAVATTTDADGKTKATVGIFLSDSTVRTVSQDLMTAATHPVNGRSPSEIGMEITKDGLVTFNEDKFKEAMAKDPAGTEAMFSEISARLAVVGKNVSDKYDGQLTSKITSQETQVRGMNDQIVSWDTRLASREASLKAVYAAMEVAMSKLNSQMSSLMSSINSLSPSKADS